MAAQGDLAMWLTFAVIAVSIFLYATERFSIEAVSLGVLAAYLVIFVVLGIETPAGRLTADELLSGFANPGLITILALLVVGQALFQTEALERPAQIIVTEVRRRGRGAIVVILVMIGALSAFMNNTPVVVMFLPLVSVLATSLGKSVSRLMMPLSFITILGGMTTLIGSSTNLLAANVARHAGVDLQFFSFTPIALLLAGTGAVYVLGVMPILLKERRTMADELRGIGAGKQFIAELTVSDGHPLVGSTPIAGLFPQLREMTVRLVQRGEKPYLPPFENLTLQAGDTVIVAATRSALQRALSGRDQVLADKSTGPTSSLPPGVVTLAEAIVAPGSRLIGRTIAQAGFYAETGCVVLGIQRRSRMPRMPMTDIRLEAGDVLLFAGPRSGVDNLRGNRDVLLVDWTAADVPMRRRAPVALGIFALVILAAASGFLPIVVAAMLGAIATIATQCLNVRQAARVVDGRIVMLIAAAIASATALEATGGAETIAMALIGALEGQSPAVIMSMLFLLIALTTNVLTNNAAAVLFTPIAIGVAEILGLPAEGFVVTVILAANCSFATPVAYQTNLLVMGPGHYRFLDFVLAGAPLVVLLWIVFSFVGPWYYGL